MSNFLIINKILCFNLFILVNKIRIKCKAIFEFNLIFIKVDIFLYFVVSETGWLFISKYVLSVFSKNYRKK